MAKFKFSDIAYNITDKKMPVSGDEILYIGLEHMDSGNLRVTRWGSKVPLIGEKLVMKKGDILFGRRNTYLRRASIAPHDGLFSAHGMIFRPKTNVIDKEYFPFFIASDYFIDEAIKISVGSLSPTVNWGTLKKLEFELPGLEKQRKLAKILWAAEETKQAYKKLLQKTDDAVKAKFEEMFGNISTNKFKWNIKKIKEVATCIAGATPSTEKKEYWQNGTIPWLSSGEVHKERIFDTDKKITQLGYDNCSTKFIPAHTVVLALAGQGKTRGTVAVAEIRLCTNQSICSIVNNSSINTDYLYYYLKLQYNELRNVSNGAGGRGGLNLSIVGQFKILLPPLPLQDQFAEILQQAEQSKRQLKQSLESLNDMMHALVNQSFN